jgi:anti-sigma B factor antagonist
MEAEGLPLPAALPIPSIEPLSYADKTKLLSVTVRESDEAVLVAHVTGELDMLTGPLLQDHLSEILATRPEHLVIDLSEVSFLGSTGLTVLLTARETAIRQNTRLQLVETGEGQDAGGEAVGYQL